MTDIPPARGRRGDPDWTPRLVAFAVVQFVVVCVAAYFFWSWVTP